MFVVWLLRLFVLLLYLFSDFLLACLLAYLPDCLLVSLDCLVAVVWLSGCLVVW